ncbi:MULTISPECIES: helix-turn-helix domain-containing protein [Pseudidiomarina]|uniref:XRE family transcriptional regulator n=1 Tax=Pseudidiomarina donghaiensis TaxID=519452 RepID=A0A432XK11_9GAMM|nr:MULTISPECIES: helix-turn-helix transcriptional regulator [Pseudidiomarina]RUO48966.1 XRE family transcriptional regulator [Pseudidiomarina donghaiensis]SFV20331.1 Helix-turn-helix [Pseudidiomarina donghaiensis]
MTPQEISKAINKKGFDQGAIAHALNCSPSLISKIINRKAISMRVAKAVALTIELPLLEVFPEYERLVRPVLTREKQQELLKSKLIDLL